MAESEEEKQSVNPFSPSRAFGNGLSKEHIANAEGKGALCTRTFPSKLCNQTYKKAVINWFRIFRSC
jgi:hypothetical protein